MTGERYRPITRESKQPTAREVNQHSGFPIDVKPKRWSGASGYAPISGGSGDLQETPESIKAVFDVYFSALTEASQKLSKMTKDEVAKRKDLHKEVVRLSNKHPELFADFIRAFDSKPHREWSPDEEEYLQRWVDQQKKEE